MDINATQLKRWEKRARRRLFVHVDRARMTWKDWVVMLALTAAYAVAAFTNLGATEIPETFYTMQKAGDEIVAAFEDSEQIETVKYYTSFGDGSASLFYSDDGEGWTQLSRSEMSEETGDGEGGVMVENPVMIDHGAIDMYEWRFLPASFSAKYVMLRVETPGVQVLEMGFCGADGLPVKVVSVQNTNPDAARGNPPANMFDEQRFVPVRTYYMNEMYFDEVYHARTAYEQILHMYPYEITHPPLGKSIIGLGIRIFGMNPFGWRFMGALFGVLMLPLMYYFAKRLFKRTLFAFIPTFLFATDFMHYTQTRIATIDSFSVFFIMLMVLFMFIYWEQNYNRQPLIKTLIPLGLSGIAFGLGASTKWLCLYAGLGLAVMLMIQLVKRHREFRYAWHALVGDEPEHAMDEKKRAYLEDIYFNYRKRTLLTLGWCVLFFIVVPAVIYYLAYIPYMRVADNPFDLRAIWLNQEYMFNYHGVAVVSADIHPFASEWYKWPVIYRPVFLFMGQGYPEGVMSSMSTMGNPAVWWGGLLAVLALLLIRVNKGPFGKRAWFLSIAALSQYLPWVIIPRQTYIYHYFATVPFLILLMGMLAKWIIEETEKKPVRQLRIFGRGTTAVWRPALAGKTSVFVFLAICLALFVMFYPITTGVPVLRSYSDTYLRWLPTWPFY